MVATSGKGWKLAPSLVRFVKEVDARWPGRDTSSDGSIGDQSHAARSSQHNPDHDPDPMPAGYVSAVDITKDSAAQMETIRKALIADPRTWYVIHNGKIWSRTHNFAAREYDGTNPHKGHLHVSLNQTAAAANSTGSWDLGKTSSNPKPPPVADHKDGSRTLREGDDGSDVATVQRFIGYGLKADGHFGPLTREAVKKYQRMRGLSADGVVGKATWRAILAGMKAAAS